MPKICHAGAWFCSQYVAATLPVPERPGWRGLLCREEEEEGSRQPGNLWKSFPNTSDTQEPRCSHWTSSYSPSCLVGSHWAGGHATAPPWWASRCYFLSVLSNEKHLHPVNLSFALIKALDAGN